MSIHMTTDQVAARAIEMVNELLSFKSKEDGVPRSPIGVLDPKSGDDQFARDAQEVAMLVFAAQQAIPLMERLAGIGRDLEARGVIAVDHGESYADHALTHMLAGIQQGK